MTVLCRKVRTGQNFLTCEDGHTHNSVLSWTRICKHTSTYQLGMHTPTLVSLVHQTAWKTTEALSERLQNFPFKICVMPESLRSKNFSRMNWKTWTSCWRGLREFYAGRRRGVATTTCDRRVHWDSSSKKKQILKQKATDLWNGIIE